MTVVYGLCLDFPLMMVVKLCDVVISATRGTMKKGSVRKGNNMMGLGVMGGNFS